MKIILILASLLSFSAYSQTDASDTPIWGPGDWAYVEGQASSAGNAPGCMKTCQSRTGRCATSSDPSCAFEHCTGFDSVCVDGNFRSKCHVDVIRSCPEKARACQERPAPAPNGTVDPDDETVFY